MSDPQCQSDEDAFEDRGAEARYTDLLWRVVANAGRGSPERRP